MIDALITVLWYILLCWLVGLAVLLAFTIWAVWSERKARREGRCRCVYPWPIAGVCQICGFKAVRRRVDKGRRS